MILVTGGAGFIGGNFVLQWFAGEHNEPLVNVDKLTYAGNLDTLSSISERDDYFFEKVDIADEVEIKRIIAQYKPRAIVHFAAESHVDRSITDPGAFVRTNVVGTFNLLEQARHYWNDLPEPQKSEFRFLHVSTDEVYGTLEANDPAFCETTPYQPNSPYSASKAGSDMLVRAYYHTYGFPVVTTNCSNNYGPYQFPEKLIPVVILNALAGKPLPIYGNGQNIRDWLYVGDHCAAIRLALANGRLGETYVVGGLNEKTNMEVVHSICNILDEVRPRDAGSYAEQITFVKDRPGHDARYAINPEKIQAELGFKPAHTFETGLRETVLWYLNNNEWITRVQTGEYTQWVDQHYAQARGV